MNGDEQIRIMLTSNADALAQRDVNISIAGGINHVVTLCPELARQFAGKSQRHIFHARATTGIGLTPP